MFEIGEMDLVDEITANGQYGVMNVNYNGKEHKALIKEMVKKLYLQYQFIILVKNT